MPLSTSTPLAPPPALARAGWRRLAIAASALVALALLGGTPALSVPPSADETGATNETSAINETGATNETSSNEEAGSADQSLATSRASQTDRLRLRGPWGSSLGIGGSFGSRLRSRRPVWKLRLNFALDLNPFGDE